MGCLLPAFHPDVWPPSNASRRGTVATGSARGLKTWLFTVRAGFGTLGCVLTAFNPDVWPPSNPPRQGTAAAGCRLWHNGLCFNGFQSGRLAALKPSLAGYGCIRQPLPLLGASTGGVRLPLALLGASKLGFSPFPAGSGTMGCVLTAFNPDVWPPSKPSPAGYGCHWAAGFGTMGCFLPAFNPDVWPPSNPPPAGHCCIRQPLPLLRGFENWILRFSGRL